MKRAGILGGGLSVAEAVTLVGMLIGGVAAFSSVQTQLQNDTYRITALENHSVPRAEQEAREQEQQKREQDWNKRLDRIEGKLDELIARGGR